MTQPWQSWDDAHPVAVALDDYLGRGVVLYDDGLCVVNCGRDRRRGQVTCGAGPCIGHWSDWPEQDRAVLCESVVLADVAMPLPPLPWWSIVALLAVLSAGGAVLVIGGLLLAGKLLGVWL